MLKVLIRKANKGDISQILTLLKNQYDLHNSFYPNFYHKWSPELSKKATVFLEDLLDHAESEVWVAEINEEISGLISFSVTNRDHFDTKVQEFLDISELIVAPNNRGSGIGTKLITKAKERAKKIGVKMLSVPISLKNENAMSFYKKMGFEMKEVIGFASVE